MLIGISQRVSSLEYGEVRDCLDQKWATLICRLGHTPVPLCNVVRPVDDYMAEFPINAVILSGGNDLAELPDAQNISLERDAFELDLIRSCLDTNVPILGVCRGMQMINSFFGGTLAPVRGHVASRHTVRFNHTSVEVNSYHNWGIGESNLASELEILAQSDDGNIEAVQAKNLLAMMWHPEREDDLTSIDSHMFQLFLKGLS